MQKFIIQIPGEYDIHQAGAMAGRLKELDIPVYLQDAQQAQQAQQVQQEQQEPKVKARPKGPSTRWSSNPITYTKQRQAITEVLQHLRPGKTYRFPEIKRMVLEQGFWRSPVSFLALSTSDGLLKRVSRGHYKLTEKGQAWISSSMRIVS